MRVVLLLVVTCVLTVSIRASEEESGKNKKKHQQKRPIDEFQLHFLARSRGDRRVLLLGCV